jgi:hypothetical protein
MKLQLPVSTVSPSILLAIVRNKALVVLNIRMELLHGFQELSGYAMATGGHPGVQVHLDGLHHLQGLVDVPMFRRPKFRTTGSRRG